MVLQESFYKSTRKSSLFLISFLIFPSSPLLTVSSESASWRRRRIFSFSFHRSLALSFYSFCQLPTALYPFSPSFRLCQERLRRTLAGLSLCFTSSHLLTFSSSHLLIFSSSPLLLPCHVSISSSFCSTKLSI